MKHSHHLTILTCLVITAVSACSAEKQESSLLEKKLKDRVEAVNKFYKENSGQATITIISPIKVSLNVKENSAVTDTERFVWSGVNIKTETGRLNLSAHKSYQWRL